MSLQGPMSRIPVRNGNNGSGHKRTISAPSKLEQMQMVLQARIEKEKQEKLARDREERMLQVYNQEQERQNRQISKYGYNGQVSKAKPGVNVGGVRQFFQDRRYDSGSAGKGIRGKPPLPHQKNSAGRDRGNPLAPLNRRSPLVDYNDVGVLGQPDSPTGLRNSPKPTNHMKTRSKLTRPQRGPYGTPNDSGNESSGYEDQNQYRNKKNNKFYRKPSKLNSNQYQASSEEDVNNTPKRQSSFQQWKQERTAGNKGTLPRSTPLHSGYNSDGPVSDFAKWQRDMDQEREDRLHQHRERNGNRDGSNPGSPKNYEDEEPPSISSRKQQIRQPPTRRTSQRSQPSTGRYHSAGEEDTAPLSNRSNVSKASSTAMDRNAQLQAELKRKEQELLNMIQKQQQELESLKIQREQEEAEEEREMKKRLEEQVERKRRAKAAAEERRAQNSVSRHSNVSDEPQHMPSPPPADMPKTFARKARRVRPAPRKQPPPPPAPTDDAPSFYDTSKAAEFYENVAADDPDAAPVQLNLRPCTLCGRKFAAERLSKHQVACKKAQQASNKRKVFDPKKMRTEGTEMAKYATNPKPEPKKKQTGDWRKKHEDFINAIRYAKKVTEVEKQGGKVSDLPPPPRTENAHYKQCPYCERRFAPDTAERHIPKCKDIKARPAPVKRRGR